MGIRRTIRRAGLNVIIAPKKIKGYSVSGAKRWSRSVYRDLKKNKKYSLSKKIWAYRRGFLPRYVEQLGITNENINEVFSERDYNYVASINGTYSKWINDEITTHKVLKKFADYLPSAYYHFFRRGTELCIRGMGQLPEGYGESLEEVMRFIRDKKEVILKATKYSQGYERRIRYMDKTGEFRFNGIATSEKEIKDIITDKVRKGMSLVLLERISIHSEMKVHNNAKVTICKLIVINETGNKGEIADAHLLFDAGSSFREKDGNLVTVDHIEDYLKENASLSAEEAENAGDKQENLVKDGKVYQINSDIRTRRIVCPVNVEDGSYMGGVELLDGKLLQQEVNPRTGDKIDGVIPNWKLVKEKIDEICRYIPQVEFMGVDIVITPTGFQIVKFEDMPPYSRVYRFNEKTTRFLNIKLQEKKKECTSGRAKRAEFARLSRLNWMSFVSKLFYPNGIRRRLTLYWIDEIFTDFRENKDVPFRDKIWAYRHGFLSYRLKQYGITRENHLDYISDLEYLFVRHINNDYKAWLEDKITIKYLCQEYKECFPSYYYYVSMRNGDSRIIPLMDCPEGYGTTHQDIIRLAKKVGILALKPDKGSWGKGFYRLEYKNDRFYLNFEEATEQEVLELLSNPDTQYLVTEYIQMHSDLKRIYSGSVNTIRMIVYKRDGKNAKIGNAYMRFGSKATGAVDNMRAGGMFARIDIETGHYYDAKILENNMIVDRECHPDTGVKIEGILPNWDKVKKLVVDIANSFDQLEYFGFDIAITEDGIKLPEINRYPGYPRIETFNRDTIDYLLERLMEKEKLYGYDRKRPHKLMKLQDRTGR